MKKRRRWLFNILTGLSLLLCVAAVALWVWSYFAAGVVLAKWTSRSSEHSASARLEDGLLLVESQTDPVRPSGAAGGSRPAEWRLEREEPRHDLRPIPRGDGPRWLSRGASVAWRVKKGGRSRWWILPWWPVVLATAVLPLGKAWGLGRRAFLRRRVGRCPGCGYDLTGNVSGVCPECGATIAKPIA